MPDSRNADLIALDRGVENMLGNRVRGVGDELIEIGDMAREIAQRRGRPVDRRQNVVSGDGGGAGRSPLARKSRPLHGTRSGQQRNRHAPRRRRGEAHRRRVDRKSKPCLPCPSLWRLLFPGASFPLCGASVLRLETQGEEKLGDLVALAVEADAPQSDGLRLSAIVEEAMPALHHLLLLWLVMAAMVRLCTGIQTGSPVFDGTHSMTPSGLSKTISGVGCRHPELFAADRK